MSEGQRLARRFGDGGAGVETECRSVRLRHFFRGARRRAASAPRQRHRQMAGATEQPIVLEAALSSTIGNRHDVIGFPSGLCRAPGASSRTIRHRRLRPRPLAMRLDHVESANLTDALVAFLDLLTDVPGTASDFPLVHARVAAERAARRSNRSAAPAANRFTRIVAIGLAPLFGCDDTRAASAH